MDSPTTYNVIGTPASATTLTATVTDTTGTVFCKGYRRARIEGTFTPGANNQIAHVLIETSNDITTSTPSNFYPIGSSVTGTTSIDVYADSGTGRGTASGLFLRIPGDTTTANGTAVSFSEPVNDLTANWLRISARDSGSANFGTLFLRITFFPE